MHCTKFQTHDLTNILSISGQGITSDQFYFIPIYLLIKEIWRKLQLSQSQIVRQNENHPHNNKMLRHPLLLVWATGEIQVVLYWRKYWGWLYNKPYGFFSLHQKYTITYQFLLITLPNTWITLMNTSFFQPVFPHRKWINVPLVKIVGESERSLDTSAASRGNQTSGYQVCDVILNMADLRNVVLSKKRSVTFIILITAM